MKTKIYVCLGLVVLSLVGATILVMKQNKNSEMTEIQNITRESPVSPKENIQNAGKVGLKTYTNTMYGFSFKYPGELSAYEWYPDGKKYAPATAIVKVGFGNNIILSKLDYSNPNSIIEEYPTDITSIRIAEENGEFFIKNATDAEDVWNKIGKTNETGSVVNELVEIKNINGEKFIIYRQHGWSIAAQGYVWSYQALFAHKGKFFWINAEEATTKEVFYAFINSFEFTS